jgi:hypothetical protein
MIQSFRAKCIRIINPSLSTRIALIELPDPASNVTKIDEITLDNIIEKLGGNGDILVLIDYDILAFKYELSIEKLLSRIEKYKEKLTDAKSSIEKYVCMNRTFHSTSRQELLQCFHRSGYQSNYLFS